MKIGFLSDTHGNLTDTLKALDLLEDCDKILHLGDILAHGPRNSITDGYNPKSLAEILKERDNIFYIKGNCDADVDQMVLEKDISNSYGFFNWGDLKIFACHGYLESDNSRYYMALEKEANLIVSGHTHIKALDKLDNMVILNPGSTSLPKDFSKSVCVYEDKTFRLIDLDTKKVIKELKI